MADETKKPERKKMTRAEAGRKGGNKTRERYGSQFFREIGRVGGSRGTSAVRKSFGEATRSGRENGETNGAATNEESERESIE